MNAHPNLFCKLFKRMLIAATAGLAVHAQALTPSSIGVTWALQNPTLTNESLNGVARNGDDKVANPSTVLVAVGSHGTILSATAATGPWTAHPVTGLTANLNAVAWSQQFGYFVAVGDKGTFLTSPDGVTWTQRSLTWMATGSTVAQTAAEDFSCVTWTTSKFYVGGNGAAGAVVYGVTNPTTPWTKFASLGAGTKIHTITGTPSTNVMGFTDTKLFVHSASTVSASAAWTQYPLPSAGTRTETYIQSAVYTNGGTNPGLVVSGATAWDSSTFTSWTPHVEVTDPNLNLSWNLSPTGDEVVGVGANGAVWISPTGVSSGSPPPVVWTKLPVVDPILQLHAGVKFAAASSPAYYVVVGDGGRIFSIPAATPTAWTSGYSTGAIDNLTAVGANGGDVVALSATGTFLSTDNGSTWARAAAPSNFAPTSVAGVGTAGFIATGAGIWNSSDGTTWTASSTAITGRLNRIISLGSGNAIAVGADTSGAAPASMIYQYTGTTTAWAKVTLPVGSSQELRGIAVSSALKLSVAVGDGGMVLTLSNGQSSWVKHTVALAKGEGFTDVIAVTIPTVTATQTFTTSEFLASTSLGGVWSSPDGVVWTKQRASSSAGITRLVDTVITPAEQYVGVGGIGTTIRSFGGISWYESNAGTSQSFSDAVWTGSTLVAVGANGTIMTSSGVEPPRPTLSFTASTTTFGEGTGTGTVTLTVQLSPASLLPVTVAYSGSTSTPTSTGLATLGTSASADYSLPTPQLLTFNPGDTSKTITVTIKQDSAVEADDIATITLSPPTGDATLGSPAQHVITIKDYNAYPYFPATANQPQNQLVNVNAPLILTATAGGFTQPTGLWKKNGANVVGATFKPTLNTPTPPALPTTTFTCTYPSPPGASIAQAGVYTLLLTNPSGTLLSNPAQVGVVDNTSKTVVVINNTTVTLTVTAAGNGLSYQWMRANSGSSPSTPSAMVDTVLPDKTIVGSKTAKLVIQNFGLTQADTYYCVVTQSAPSGTPPTVVGGTTLVEVVNAVPAVAPVVFPAVNYIVGQPFSFTPTASAYPSKWSITGLPPGLAYNTATGQITGNATKAGDFVINFTATNVMGASTATSAMVTISPMPAGISGAFMGLMNPASTTSQGVTQAVLNNSLGARLDLTVSDTSLYTGKLTYGTLATAFTGALTYNPPPPNPVPLPQGYVNPGVTYTGSVSVTPKGFNAVTMTFTIFPTSCPTTPNTVNITITDGKENPVLFTGWRNMWQSLTSSTAPTVSSMTGYYNLALAVRYYFSGYPDLTAPQGYSIAAFTLVADGSLSMSGQMSDGTPFTSSGFVNAVGGLTTVQVPIYAGLYSNTGVVDGIMTINPGMDNNVTPAVANSQYNSLTGPGTIVWTKNIQTGPTPNYPGGFGTPSQTNGKFNGVLNVIVSSGRYTPPQNAGEIVMDLPNKTNNASMRFLDGGLNIITDNTTNPPTRTEQVAKDPDVPLFQVNYPAAVIIPPGQLAGTTLSFFPATGTFSGTFTLVDVDTKGNGQTVTRKVTYNGLIVGHRLVPLGKSNGVENGVGYFVAPQLPSANSGPLSGGVQIYRSVNDHP